MDFYEMRHALEKAVMANKEVTRYSVWDMLSRRQHVSKLADMVPASSYAQITELAQDLAKEFSSIEQTYLTELTALPFDDGDEAVEHSLQQSEHQDLLRLMLTGEDYAPIIWKMLEPEKS